MSPRNKDAFICSRCGEIFYIKEMSLVIIDPDTNEELSYTLCPDCYEEAKEFLNKWEYEERKHYSEDNV